MSCQSGELAMTWSTRNGNACGERSALENGVCVYDYSPVHRAGGVGLRGNTSANEIRQSLKHLSAQRYKCEAHLVRGR